MAALKWRLYNRVPLLECTRGIHALRIKCASHVFLVKIIRTPEPTFSRMMYLNIFCIVSLTSIRLVQEPMKRAILERLSRCRVG